jgi:7,8-dihydropterin-6-yl-methyl-4-(beta-D-ribofuranosyl)aminobenzene 5'-phosphate synthase
MNAGYGLQAVDRVEVVTLIDNYTDMLLESTKTVSRPPRAKGGEISRDTLVAEHGLSLLVRVFEGERKHTILFDTGYTEFGVPHNLRKLELDAKEIRAIVLSHAHMDHTGSLHYFLDALPKPVPVALHPDAFVFPRYRSLDDGGRVLFPRTLIKGEMEKRGARIIPTKEPVLLEEGMILVTGEVERSTSFEKGLPNALVEKDGKIQEDEIPDDQALIIRLKGKGLVVISGCSHSGIVNTLVYAKKITGLEKIYAVLGGFHLSGPAFEPILDQTIAALKKMKPDLIVPMHCTGWKAIHAISEAFPSAFVLNSVGSRFILG